MLCEQGVQRKWVGAGAGAEIERERGECDVNDVEPLALCPGVDPEPRWGALNNVDLLKEHRLPLPAGQNQDEIGEEEEEEEGDEEEEEEEEEEDNVQKNARVCEKTRTRIDLSQSGCARFPGESNKVPLHALFSPPCSPWQSLE